jgi:phosphoribosyl 1,2-cyclic phosphate phosphodiesterase
MRLQFLGTGGSTPIPLPTCDCDICTEAVEHGAPDARRGYSLFLHDIDGLIDAPEFAPGNLTRWRIETLRYLFLTHWHPDHTAGLRAATMRPTDPGPGETALDAKRRTAPTVVTTRAVYERTAETVGTLPFLVSEGYLDVHFLDEEPFVVDGVEVRAIPYALDDSDGPPEATAFVFERGATTLAVVADDARRFDESRLPSGLTAAVFESGHFTHAPDGERIRSPDFPGDDLAHEEVMDRVRRVAPEQAFLSHLGHHYRRSHEDYQRLAEEYDADDSLGTTVRFPHDGQTVEIAGDTPAETRQWSEGQ